MPNNSSARQKKQSKKKKTDPLPLHKEDKASVDSTSLSLAGMDKASTMDKACTVDRSSMDKASLDGSSLSLVGTKEAANIAVPICSEGALLLEFNRSAPYRR